MTNLQWMLEQEAYGFAERKDIESAIKIVDILKVLGVPEEEIAELRNKVGLTYLKRCKEVKFGIVPPYALHTATVDADDEHESDDNQYIGLSPYALQTFQVSRPIYYKELRNKKVLFPQNGKWYYVSLKDGGDYGGRVIHAHDGVYWVIPFFNLERIKMLAQEHIRELGDVNSHVWERPENFWTKPAECEYVQHVETKLAVKHYGLPYASF